LDDSELIKADEKIPRWDVPDFPKGTKVRIRGGRDVWTVVGNPDDDIILVNGYGVVISCDYARLIIL
jgi:hypothetical protein